MIPCFNAEQFIEKAVYSVVEQKEVSEIIVVNDGSTDSTQIKLDQLLQRIPNLHVYNHPKAKNRGRSASRNLGIKKASNPFIAFLDADDYYLPNRFGNDVQLFEQDHTVDGIYNAIGVHFYRAAEQQEKERLQLTTITENIPPQQLFDAMLSGKHGHFHINGLTLKTTVFKSVGYFSKSLKVAEDTELFFRLALKCKLRTGLTHTAVAIRGVHSSNVFNRTDLYCIYNLKMMRSLVVWSSRHQVPLYKIDKILERLWLMRYKAKNNLIKDIIYWKLMVLSSPKILFTYLTVKYYPIVRKRKKLFPYLFK